MLELPRLWLIDWARFYVSLDTFLVFIHLGVDIDRIWMILCLYGVYLIFAEQSVYQMLQSQRMSLMSLYGCRHMQCRCPKRRHWWAGNSGEHSGNSVLILLIFLSAIKWANTKQVNKARQRSNFNQFSILECRMNWLLLSLSDIVKSSQLLRELIFTCGM